MTHRVETRWTKSRRLMAIGLGVVAVTLAGCGEEPEQQAERVVVAPPPPPASPLEQIRLNPKVEFPEEYEPSTVEIAEAVAEFASAFATGSANAANDYLMEPDRAVLAQMLDTGDWADATGSLELVRVVALEEIEGSLLLGLAMQSEGEAYLLAWRGVQDGGSWVFTALPIESRTAPSARALDGADLSGF